MASYRGIERIHNINNMVKLPHEKGSIHAKVTGYCNSKWDKSSIHIRDHVNTFSYEEQYKFGINVLKMFGWKQ